MNSAMVIDSAPASTRTIERRLMAAAYRLAAEDYLNRA
jgi:hypothetical protein